MIRSIGIYGVRRYVMTTIAGIVVATFAGAARPVHAQTLFEWPKPSAFDPSHLTSADACLAMATRLRDSVVRNNPVWLDTLPQSKEEILGQPPAYAKTAAATCSNRFHADKAPLAEWVSLFRLYLIAGKDAEAKTLADRRLAQVPVNLKQERGGVLDTVISLYIKAQPARFAATDQYVEEMVALGSERPLANRLGILGGIMEAARKAEDLVRTQRTARWISDIPNSLSAAEKRSDFYTAASFAFFMAKMFTMQLELADSLRHGTPGYVTLQRKYWEQITGEAGISFKLPIGEKATTITGDFWLPANAKGSQRPVPGKTNVIWFSSCSRECEGDFAVVRRMAKRFPDVAITMIYQTEGFIYPRLIPDSTEEAAIVEKNALANAFPGVISISKVPSWRLPNPDRRIILQMTANTENYSFGKSIPAGPGAGIIVDRDGTIVHYGGINRYDEPIFNLILSVLESRPDATVK